MNDRCKTCIWACKRDHDTAMRLCKYLNLEVIGDSMPCKHYERFDDNFYRSRSIESAVQ